MGNPDKAALVQAWQQRKRELSAAQQQVRQAAFHLLCTGQVATEAALMVQTGMSLADVRTALTALETHGLVVHEPARGGVVGAYGLSLLPTSHALHLHGRDLFTWCALDAVGIPAGLGADATVHSRCFTCQQALSLTYTAGTITPSAPTAPLLWLTAPVMGESLRGST